MNDDFVSVADDLPQIANGMKSVSVDVLAMVDGGNLTRAFYCYRTREWYGQSGKRVKGDVVAWQSI